MGFQVTFKKSVSGIAANIVATTTATSSKSDDVTVSICPMTNQIGFG